MHFGTCYVDCKPQTQQGSPASASRVYLFFFFFGRNQLCNPNWPQTPRCQNYRSDPILPQVWFLHFEAFVKR